MTSRISAAWIEAINIRYRNEEVPHRHRPFRAFTDFCQEKGLALSFSSPEAKEIFAWFKAHSAPGAHEIGALFTGAFYFDTCFWPLNIPVGYGQFRVNALDCLTTMPTAIKRQIGESKQDLWRLAYYWADCVDYAYGFDDLAKQETLRGTAALFAQNGDRELLGAITQLITPRPNTRAALGLRMSAEIFMKALLIHERGLTEQQLKKLGHRIDEIARQCFDVTGVREFEAVSAHPGVFPNIGARYDGEEKAPAEIWNAVLSAQTVATAVVRRYTDRDMRHQLRQSS